ncbi:MAG: glycosyltransferase [Proteobacteria bacterium]|nr:glycosyltransferase [Pseudomonadota bacterium]
MATKISLALADDIIAISPGIIELLQSKYGVPEGKAIHLAPISVEQHELKKNWRDTNGQIHFGIFARLSSDKGIQYALKALAKLHAEGTKATLDIYGEGNYSQQLLNLTKNLGLQEIVRFHTWVAQPLNQMLKIDCLLLPSLSEGTPRCILEAASLGIPCIATLVGGVPDIIDHGKTGWLVPFGHPPKLAEAMRRVIVDPLILIKAGTQAMAKIQSSHSIANEITNLTRVFEQVNAP